MRPLQPVVKGLNYSGGNPQNLQYKNASFQAPSQTDYISYAPGRTTFRKDDPDYSNTAPEMMLVFKIEGAGLIDWASVRARLYNSTTAGVEWFIACDGVFSGAKYITHASSDAQVYISTIDNVKNYFNKSFEIWVRNWGADHSKYSTQYLEIDYVYLKGVY